jgi:hypothetical protein
MLFLPEHESTEPPEPVRRLSDGPNYEPHWRWQVFERFALRISRAKNSVSELDKLVTEEGDPFIRQLLQSQYRRHCIIPNQIAYALRCHQTNSSTRIGSLTEALIIADRTTAQIAADIGTTPDNVRAYEKLFFDARKYRDHRGWFAQLCLRAVPQRSRVEQECDRQWRSLAHRRGFAGLAPAIFAQQKPPSSSTPHAAFVRSLLCRASDFISDLDATGVLPTERDMAMLGAVLQRWEGVGWPVALNDLKHSEPVEPEKERADKEAHDLISGLSADRRRAICDFIARLEEAAVASAANTTG